MDTLQRVMLSTHYKKQLQEGFCTAINAKMALQIVGLDLIGPYRSSEKNNCHFCFVFVDYFSKWVELVPLKRTLAKTMATALFSNFISNLGLYCMSFQIMIVILCQRFLKIYITILEFSI